MGKRFFIRVGTRTTPRKQSVIKAAKEGRMEQRHLDYVMTKYRAALYISLETLLGRDRIGNILLSEFIDDCVKDAFVRINEYDPQYKFRTFLVNKIVWPAINKIRLEQKREKEAIANYFEWKHSKENFTGILSQATAKMFIDEGLKQLKEQEPLKYEVLYLHYFKKVPYKKIYEQLKDSVTMRVSSVDYAEKLYQRAVVKLKHLYRELIRNKKYVDNDLPFTAGLKRKFHEVTTKKRNHR